MILNDSASLSGFSQETQPASESEASFHRFSEASIPAACVRRSLLQNRWRSMARKRPAEARQHKGRSTLTKMRRSSIWSFQRSIIIYIWYNYSECYPSKIFEKPMKNLTTSHVPCVPCFRRIKWMRLQMQWRPSLTDSEKIGTLQRRRLGTSWLGAPPVYSYLLWTSMSWRAEDCWKKVELNVGSSSWAKEIMEKDGETIWDDRMTFALAILTTLTKTWQH